MNEKIILVVLIILVIILIVCTLNKETFITADQLNHFNIRGIARIYIKETDDKNSVKKGTIRYVAVTKDNDVFDLTQKEFNKIKDAAMNTTDNSFFNTEYILQSKGI